MAQLVLGIPNMFIGVFLLILGYWAPSALLVNFFLIFPWLCSGGLLRLELFGCLVHNVRLKV